MNYKRLFVPNSIVFLTIVTHNRLPIIKKNYSAMFDAILEVKQHYSFEVIAYIFMPDHIHILIKPENIEKYPKIVHSIKYNFRRKLNIDIVGVATPTYLDNVNVANVSVGLNCSTDNSHKNKIFQNRYYEHTIRNKDDLYRHLDYIHYNPMKHYNIAPKDWEYSSFNNFVEKGYYTADWCNFDDEYSINSLDLE